MEKSGKVTMTEEELVDLQKGKVSERLEKAWDLSYNELCEVVKNKLYILVSKKS